MLLNPPHHQCQPQAAQRQDGEVHRQGHAPSGPVRLLAASDAIGRNWRQGFHDRVLVHRRPRQAWTKHAKRHQYDGSESLDPIGQLHIDTLGGSVEFFPLRHRCNHHANITFQ